MLAVRLPGDEDARGAKCARSRFTIFSERDVPSEGIPETESFSGRRDSLPNPAFPTMRPAYPCEADGPHRLTDLMKHPCVAFVRRALPNMGAPLKTNVGPRPVRLHSDKKMDVPFVGHLAGGVGDIGSLRVSRSDRANPLRELR